MSTQPRNCTPARVQLIRFEFQHSRFRERFLQLHLGILQTLPSIPGKQTLISVHHVRWSPLSRRANERHHRSDSTVVLRSVSMYVQFPAYLHRLALLRSSFARGTTDQVTRSLLSLPFRASEH